MIYKIVKTILLSVVCISVFEIHAQQSQSSPIVLSELRADLGIMQGEEQLNKLFLFAEFKTSQIASMNALDIKLALKDTSIVRTYHFTILKVQGEYVIRDDKGTESVISDGKIRLRILLDMPRNMIKAAYFTGSSVVGVSNTLVRQF